MESLLEDCTILTVCERVFHLVEGDHPLGNRRIILEEQRKEIEAGRAERKVGEKPRLPVSICEDCTESWLAMRAKALYNSDIFPPCLIIQIMGFLAEAFPEIFFCVLCIDSSSFGYIVQLDI